MSFLLDTCILSELTRPNANAEVVHWLAQLPERATSVSVISLAEIKYGILRLAAGRKRTGLELWYEQELVPSLAERILDFDLAVLMKWAALRAEYPNAPVLDSQIAATALEHGLTLATRNVRDFAIGDLSVFNPWSK